ncbi:isochorismate synthase [Galbibacter sp. BG1]|uniref:isochorismate synthase n=1 Tax=Galbibacter sp. BG1 TaxID=1170699 RepID=UPI0015BCF07D|nr:isochorismate synthase [Galbibacter sp. BG1]QLE02516.1 isochorismate synthase [Galbibacter sp. BG1]
MSLTHNAFFKKVETQHKSNLPFVIYRNPNGSIINGLLQSNDELFFTENYTERGFVFTPFEENNKGILIPLESAEIISTEASVNSEITYDLALQKEDTAKKRHLEIVSKTIDAIQNSTLEKVVVSRKKEIAIPNLEVISVFKKLVHTYGKAFCYLWYHPKVGVWLGATPETLLSVENGQFKTMALAGTQPYVDTINVEWGEKEKQEQQLVTDSILESIKPFIQNVSVSEVKTVQAGNLLHLRTDISGELANASIEKVITSLHPTPAVCGLPKKDAKQYILKHEGYNREFYTGFLGELNMSNDGNSKTELYVNLRCMQYSNSQKLQIYVGGGITKDSNAASEWEETVNKTQTMLDVLLK